MGRTACTEPQCLYKGAPYLTLYDSFQPVNRGELSDGLTLHVR
jgi:hypothetical protein